MTKLTAEILVTHPDDDTPLGVAEVADDEYDTHRVEVTHGDATIVIAFGDDAQPGVEVVVTAYGVNRTMFRSTQDAKPEA